MIVCWSRRILAFGIKRLVAAFIFLVAFSIASLFLTSIPASANQWTVESIDLVDEYSLTYFYPRAIAVEKDTSRPHMVYFGDYLYHAFFDGVNWRYEIVDSQSYYVTHASIALDSANKAHISYYDATSGDLMYATNASGTWVSSTIDSLGNVGLYASIALDIYNNVHISYYDATKGDLKYASNASGTWVSSTIDSLVNVGLYSSIALDSNNNAHISYYDATNGDLKYAVSDSDAWESFTIDSINNVGLDSSIALDSNNYAHISYYDETNGDLRYATNTSGVWVSSKASSTGDVGLYNSIALDSTNKIYITFYDATNGNLRYVSKTLTGTVWSAYTLYSAGDVGILTSLAVDSNNKLHISYSQDENEIGVFDLRYATNVSGSWKSTIIEAFADSGLYPSIAVDSLRRPHMSYYNFTSGDLVYATKEGDVWVKSTIDSTNDVGLFTSIAVDSNNKVHISYYYANYGDLKYATNASGSWVVATRASTGDVGLYSSIAVDSNNKVHISYYDATNGDLKYITNASGSWVTSTIDSVGNVGLYASIAVDSSRKAHISYYDATNRDLKYATNASNSWVLSTIEGGAYCDGEELCTSIAVDSNGKAHISYSNLGVTHATNAYGYWDSEYVSYAIWGLQSSIALDSANNVHVGFYDLFGGNAIYATNTVALQPDISVSPAPHGFGDVAAGYNSDTEMFTVMNTGAADLVISSVTIAGKNPSDFVIFSDNCSARIIAPMSECDVHVAFLPQTIGLKLANMRIISNDPDTPLLDVALSGRGIANLNVVVFGGGIVKGHGIDCPDDCDETYTSYPTIILTAYPDVDFVFRGWTGCNSVSGNQCTVIFDSSNAERLIIADFGQNPNKWFDSVIDDRSMEAVFGLYTSIAVDSNKKAHVSYYDFANGDLRYATNASGAWVSSAVDSPGNVGLYTSIALDSNNKVHISYYDMTNYDLKYATNASGAWVSSAIDSAGAVGFYTSIALDSNNKVHISYYNASSGDLKYATNATGSWSRITIDSAGDVGLYTSIALDSNNKVHISYYDKTYGDLKYATNSSGSWVLTALDSSGDVGLHTSIALDSNNRLYISYYDISNSVLKYTTNALGFWIRQSVSGSSNAGSAMDMDSANNLHISFYNMQKKLSYTTNEVPLLPDISVAPVTYNFGNITAGSLSSSQTFSVANIGTADLLISSIGLTGVNQTDFIILQDNCSGVAVSPAATCGVQVAFSPLTSGSKFAGLRISSNDPDTPALTTALNGTGVSTLNVTISGEVGGIVTGTGINCPGDCTEVYSNSSNITLTAAHYTGYFFEGWTGCDSVSGNNCIVNTSQGNIVVVARFKACTYSLSHASQSFNTAGGAGSVDIMTDSVCEWSVVNDAAWIQITPPSSNKGSATLNFTVSTNSGTIARSYAMTIAGHAFTVEQAGISIVSLNVNINNQAGGKVTGQGISCPADCTETFTFHTTVTLTATPNTGYFFTGWSGGGCAGIERNCTITLDADRTVTANFQRPPDIIASALTAPAAASAGSVAIVKDTTKNSGLGSAGASTTSYYLSTNTILDAGDALLGSRTVPELASGAINSGSISVTIPAETPTGTYYIIAKADDLNAVAETNENNNTRSKIIKIGIDLVVSALTAPASASAGAVAIVKDTTKNSGLGSAGASTTSYYLSTNTILDAGDALLGSRTVPELASGAINSGSISVTIPAETPTGTYYIIAKADDLNAVAETNENNNTRSRALGVGPDLTVSALTAPTSASAGAVVSIADTTKNNGSDGSGESITYYYLSTNTTLDGSDIFLGSRHVPALSPITASSGSVLVTLPTGITGKYYIIAKADYFDAVTESNEGNNARSRVITINP